MKSISRETIVTALDDADLGPEENLYNGYSGRFMYGETCFGITGSTTDYGKFLVALASAEPDRAFDLAECVRTDGMGARGTIFYFPGFQVTDDE